MKQNVGFICAIGLRRRRRGQSRNHHVQSARKGVRSFEYEFSYMAELIGDTVHFRCASAPKGLGLVDVTASRPMNDLCCGDMLEGKLPRMMPNIFGFPLARDLPITKEMGVESYVSVPLFRNNGEFYGTFCCFSKRPNPSLNERDYNIATMFANFAGNTLHKSLEAANDLERITDRINKTI